MSDLEYKPVSVEKTDWAASAGILKQIREAVFIIEQQVPQALEWDGEDEKAIHWLAFQGTTPVGTARLLATGQVGRMAVIKEQRHQGIGSALLRSILRESPKLGFSKLFLNAQVPVIPFYERFGFVAEGDIFDDAGIPHHCMHLMLPPDRSQPHPGSDPILLKTAEEFRQYNLQVIGNARQKLALFSPDLDPLLYDNDDFVGAVMDLVKKSRNSEVRILVTETRHLLEHGHRLLRAIHRADQKIAIRKLEARPGEHNISFLIADDNAILHRPDAGTYQGACYTDNRSRVKGQLDMFDQLWQAAMVDDALKHVRI